MSKVKPIKDFVIEGTDSRGNKFAAISVVGNTGMIMQNVIIAGEKVIGDPVLVCSDENCPGRMIDGKLVCAVCDGATP